MLATFKAKNGVFDSESPKWPPVQLFYPILYIKGKNPPLLDSIIYPLDRGNGHQKMLARRPAPLKPTKA
jgi:hypothetical protein